MKYISLDIETTGIDSNQDQILQVAMIVDDLMNIRPVSQLPHMNIYLKHDRYSGNAFALQMNAHILKVLATKRSGESHTNCGREILICDKDLGYKWVESFIKDNFEKKAIAAGKNVAGFDLPFFPKQIRDLFVHRVLDPGSMYAEYDDNTPPDTAECCKRAGIDDTITHDAYDDAAQVIELIRTKLVNGYVSPKKI